MRQSIFMLAAIFLLSSCSEGSTHQINAVVNTSATVNPMISIATASPTAVSEPTRAPTSTQTPTPTPALALIQLTRGGCCVQPFWSPDSEQVLYIDRPALDLPSGIWGITLPGGEAEFITDRLGLYSADMQLRAFLQNGQTIVENMGSGEQWTIPNQGRAVRFSPDGMWVAWTAGQAGPPFDSAQREVWFSRLDGSAARNLFSITGGGLADWLPNGKLLVSERSTAGGEGHVFWIISALDEPPQKLIDVPTDGRIRGEAVSPNGNWLAYMHSFSSDDSQNGLWIVNTETGERRRLDTFGAYQWRDGNRLLVVPLDVSEPGHRLEQIEASSGEITTLTDPAVTPFRIANGDWRVSPDGRRIAFVSAEDQNIWVLELAAGQ